MYDSSFFTKAEEISSNFSVSVMVIFSTQRGRQDDRD